MAAVVVEPIGEEFDRMKAVLLRIIDGMDDNMRGELDEVAERVLHDAKVNCPVDTGSLQSSGRKESVARPAGNVWEIGVRFGGYIVNPKTHRIVDYAVKVERGTSKMMARPFLAFAVWLNRQNIRDAIRYALKRSAEEARR